MKGFTLVEVLVAISILSLVAVIGIPNLRRFNDSQTLQNTTSDLARILREAQSAANSRISCSNNLTSKEWDVVVSANNYQFIGRCFNPASTAVPSPAPITDPRYVPNADLIAGVAFSASARYLDASNATVTTGCSLPTTIRFNSQAQPYNQNRFSNLELDCIGGFNPTVGVMMITVTYNGQSQYICIDKGGSINASPTACF